MYIVGYVRVKPLCGRPLEKVLYGPEVLLFGASLEGLLASAAKGITIEILLIDCIRILA